jgi:hypothetical protein
MEHFITYFPRKETGKKKKNKETELAFGDRNVTGDKDYVDFSLNIC